MSFVKSKFHHIASSGKPGRCCITGRGFWSIAAAVVVFAGLLFGQSAKADPHGMFYTAVGQQQLFFNMLAALDQADYVEPADGDNSRNLLIQARDRAGFGPETDERLNATKTDLASLLTRSVTLEGNDLWSSYVALQFALEASRRNNTDELIRIMCERGFGRKACRTDVGENLEEEASTAFVTDSAERDSWGMMGGLSILDSGSKAQEDVVKGITAGDEEFKNLDGVPIPYSNKLAALRENIRGNTGAEMALERVVGNTLSSYQPSEIDPNLFEGIDIDPNTGKIALSFGGGSTAGSFVGSAANASESSYIKEDPVANLLGKVLGFTSLPIAVEREAMEGVAVVNKHLAQAEAQGAVADSEGKPVIENGKVKGRDVDITVPAWAKKAAGEASINSLSQMTSNSAFAPAMADYKPGDEALVGSDEATGEGPVQCKDIEDPDEDDGCNSGNVRPPYNDCTTSSGAPGKCVLDYEMRQCYLGTTPTRTEVAHYYCQATGDVRGATTAKQGQVAGLIDWLEWLWDLYSQPKEPELDSSANPVGFQHESAAHDLYEAMGLSDENGNDGGILNNSLGGSANSLMNRINGN